MTANELLAACYGWADANASLILIGAAVLPLVGAALARVGKAGKTDADGRMIASAVVGLGIAAFVLELALLVFVRQVLEKDFLEGNSLLLLAPPVFLGLSLATVRWVFPLNELGSVTQAVDIFAFVFACWGVVWLFGRFHWGVVFFGSLAQLGIIAVLGAVLIRRLYTRAFSKRDVAK
ncbi:MAG: hypothetical protein KDD82_16155 [Planctomycetes bacterium]|nr:hypothetical protein [Planctomycetota bacterium]